MSSYAKTFGLMALLAGMIVALAGWLGGSQGAVIGLAFAILLNFGSYWFSDRIVLRMYRAQKIDRAQAPELYAIVDDLRRRAGLPMPTVAIAPSEQPNAFATGRTPAKAVVCVTRGLLGTVDRDELEGILAHELAHIKNRDMLIGTMAATLAAAFVMIARFGVFFGGGDRDRGGGLLMFLVAPIAAMIVQMAISRVGEYRADRIGAGISGKPLALASALRKLEERAKRTPMRVSPSAAHLCIVNPLAGAGQAFASLFRTHPPTSERVRRLQELAA
ncbi:MAG: zinc metalloprotease HtpX [Gemmatimonadota bacterium]